MSTAKSVVKTRKTRATQLTSLHRMGQSLPSVFQTNISQTLQNSGLSTTQLSDESGLDAQTIEKLLTGKSLPSRTHLERISASPSLTVSYKKMLTWCMLDDCLRYAAPSPVA